VEAVLGYPRTVLAKVLVGDRGTIPGDDMHHLLGIHGAMNGVEEIEKAGVDGHDLLGAVVPQDVVDIRQRVLKVLSIEPVYRSEALAGVQIIEGEGSFRRGRFLNGSQERLGKEALTKSQCACLQETATAEPVLQHGMTIDVYLLHQAALRDSYKTTPSPVKVMVSIEVFRVYLFHRQPEGQT